MGSKIGFWKTSSAVAAALLAAAAGPWAGAQEPASGRFGEVVDVRLVNVEAWVTDADGNPVPGLTAADFEVREDGKPVEITHFSEIGSERLELAATPPEAEAVGTSAAPRPRAEAAPSPAHLVLYFDQSQLSVSSRNRLIQDLRAFLDSPEVVPERVLILRQEEGLYTEAGFGSDRRELEAALDRIARSGNAGNLAAQEKRLSVSRLQQIWEEVVNLGARVGDPCDRFFIRSRFEIQAYGSIAAQRIDVTLRSLETVASFLGGLDGVKILLYLSDALETAPGNDLVEMVQAICPGRAEPSAFRLPEALSMQFEEMTRGANANRVTFYALQPSGLTTGGLGSADRRGADFRFNSGQVAAALRQGERSGMALLAEETGGRTVFNRNRFGEDLTRIAEDMTSYYSLAYTPPHGGDRRGHYIEVRVPSRPRLRVRHRLAYRDKGAEEELADRLLSSLYLGVGENPLDARLGAGAMRKTEGGRYVVPLHVLVPADRLTFLPGDGGPLAGVEVDVAAKTPERPRVVRTGTSWEVRQPSVEDDPVIDLVLSLELPPGRYVLAVAVRDQASRETSYVSTSIEIAPDAEEAS